MIKRALKLALVGLVAIIAIILLRTLNYGDAPPEVSSITLPEAPDFDRSMAAARLGEAIRFQTVTTLPGDPQAGAEMPWLDFHDWMAATYPALHAVAAVETVPGGHTRLFTWNGTEPDLKPLLLMAHQDVVPINAGTERAWTHPPFEGVVTDGYIYGRGALDDKGSIIGQLEALDALARRGFAPRRTILLMLGHDEEVAGSGAQAGIALLEARGITPEMALDEGMLVIDPSPLTGKRMALIGVAEKGYVTLKLTASGDGGHSSMPVTNSAAVRLARLLVALDENQMPSHLREPPVSNLFSESASDLPFSRKLAVANKWLLGGMLEDQMSANPQANAIIRTTTAPTMLTGSAKENVLAQEASALVNFRVHPRDTIEDVVAHVERHAAKIGNITVSRVSRNGVTETPPSAISPTNTESYRVLEAVAHSVSDGAIVVPALFIAVSDARFASQITPNVYRFIPMILSPEDLTGLHGSDEKLSIENLERMITGYAQLILALDAL